MSFVLALTRQMLIKVKDKRISNLIKLLMQIAPNRVSLTSFRSRASSPKSSKDSMPQFSHTARLVQVKRSLWRAISTKKRSPMSALAKSIWAASVTMASP